MANIVVLGGGFAGIVAAESLAKGLGDEHQITLVSRSDDFIFQPALARFAFDQCGQDDLEFSVRAAMLDRRIRFVEGEVARLHPSHQLITFAHGDVIGQMPYDFLVIALGRRLRTELILGFFDNANHILDVRGAREFSQAVNRFHRGHAVIGSCRGARLPVPLFETAVALSRRLREQNVSEKCSITVVSDEWLDDMFGGVSMSERLAALMKSHEIEFVGNFSIAEINKGNIVSTDGRTLEYDLNMIIPPFGGPGALVGTGLVNAEGYVRVDQSMRCTLADRIYAAGDCVDFHGPKMAHMAVRQAHVAAENLIAEIQGKTPQAKYDHDMTLVIDAGRESTFVNKDLSSDDPATINASRFWGWAKHKQEQLWMAKHS